MRSWLGVCGAVALLAVGSAVPAHAGTDEEAVRAVLDGMNGSYNRSDFGAFAAHVCAEMRRAAGFEEGWRESRKVDGPTRIAVNSIAVNASC